MSETPNRKMTPIRVNLLAIAGLIALICFGLICVLIRALDSPDNNSFIIGAIIGLIGGGITGLASLGTTLLNDK